jgi:hypothetical protein
MTPDHIDILPLTFGRARVVAGGDGANVYDDAW